MTRFRHPEAHDDEVWIGNVWKVDFPAIGWESKRLGSQTYDAHGKHLPRDVMKPVFVKREELEAAGVAIPAMGPVDHRWKPITSGRSPA